MPVHNADIADIFNRVADLLEIDGANAFRVRAYRDAARTFAGLSREASDLVAGGSDLTELPGIGEELAGKVGEIVATGRLEQLDALQDRMPPGLHDLMRIPGLGPKRVGALYGELGIGDTAALKKAAEEEKVRRLEGFGPKTEANILDGIDSGNRDRPRTPWHEAEKVASALTGHLSSRDGVKRLHAAGSLRRRKETVGDLDIVVACERGTDIMTRFAAYEDVASVVSRGETRSSVMLRSGLQVDLRKLPAAGYGAGLHYFTGSKAHNIAIRRLGQKKGFKINEYGVFRSDARVAGETESSVYERVGLPFIPPELRENRGEIEAARAGALPELVRLEDIRGDLHAHTTETDGRNSLREMVTAARERGYGYLAITNHSRNVAVAGGMDAGRLAEFVQTMTALDEEMEDFKIVKSVEVDILEDGSLDLPDDILAKLDLVVGAVHSGFDLSRDRQTERILRAMDHRLFDILAHPTGRLINRRAPYDVDVDRLIGAAADRGCFMELNAHPERLDLGAAHCQAARERGVKIALSTDAHSTRDLEHMRLGIGQARRGWLTADDVLNTRSWADIQAMLRAKT